VFPSLKSRWLGVRGAEVLCKEELEPWPGMVGGLLNLEVPDLREDGAGWISAGGASDFDGAAEVIGAREDCRWDGILVDVECSRQNDS
jgi:hypothetical protein